MEKTETQRDKILKLNESINELLVRIIHSCMYSSLLVRIIFIVHSCMYSSFNSLMIDLICDLVFCRR